MRFSLTPFSSSLTSQQVQDGPNVLHPEYASPLGRRPLAQLSPFAFIDVPTGWEDSEPGSKSKSNPVEAAMVAALVKALQKLARSSPEGGEAKRALTIGVISPYSGQVDAIGAKLGIRIVRPGSLRAAAAAEDEAGRASFVSQEKDGCVVEVRSVDGFQGREMDVIIISAVRNNTNGNIGFLSDCRCGEVWGCVGKVSSKSCAP